MISAEDARKESDKHQPKATDETTQKCIQSITKSIEIWMCRGQYTAPIDMYTSEAIEYFTNLGYKFKFENVLGFARTTIMW